MLITIPISVPDCDGEAIKTINGMRSAGYGVTVCGGGVWGGVALQQAGTLIFIALYMENKIVGRAKIYRCLIVGG